MRFRENGSLSKSQIKPPDPLELNYVKDNNTHELGEELLLPPGAKGGDSPLL